MKPDRIPNLLLLKQTKNEITYKFLKFLVINIYIYI